MPKISTPNRIVVTGALGHIGSKIIRDLPAAFPDTHILMIDNLVTQRYSSLFELPRSGRYSFIGDDVLELDIDKILQPKDVVIHLAAITDATRSFENHEEVHRVNHVATTKLAKACAKIGSYFLFPSSTSVYGTSAELVDENCARAELKPQSPYAESKLKSEEYLKRLGKNNGLKFITCRFGTISGISQGMRFHTAVNKFCWQAVMGQPLSVWSTALHQKRPYLSLNDASRAIQFIIQKNLFDREIYNVVTNNLTVDDIINAIKKFIPKINIGLVDAQIMNQLSYEVASDKFRNKGFEFSSSIHNDIRDTIKLLKRVHHHNV